MWRTSASGDRSNVTYLSRYLHGVLVECSGGSVVLLGNIGQNTYSNDQDITIIVNSRHFTIVYDAI
jgi:hypothetical protein